MIRGIRGATTISENQETEILSATEELMQEIAAKNAIEPENISHVIITVTEDINATFPARALRDLYGYTFVPVMCAQEIPVPGSLPFCIRLMVTADVSLEQHEVKHIYLNEAEKLRPDLSLTKEQGTR
ncbi:chorismate mutase [Alkalicoccus halolimnae]|uniref:chorismate mutase n=1 Tax=Alkalicoccus halolimnae TaxID=1667239 RepID=A0A5C7FH18_9BACI|nr:chorismate mutase [Alkalicoccus halolimnae]TXF83003.1 chorismate mutase [Alkalicoccus halolimnae]